MTSNNPTKREKENLNVLNGQLGINATVTNGPPFPCGCTMILPHSHLVIGHNCPCEKGRPELIPKYA